MELNSYPVPHPQTAARTIDGSAVIVLADTGELNVLNPVGTLIWELVDGTHSVQEIADAVQAEYAVSLQQALKDTEEFLQQLLDSSVITVQASADQKT